MLCVLPIAIVGYAVIANVKAAETRFAMTCLMAIGMYSSVPPILVWNSNNSAGHYKRATTSAVQLAVANAGGFVSSKKTLLPIVKCKTDLCPQPLPTQIETVRTSTGDILSFSVSCATHGSRKFHLYISRCHLYCTSLVIAYSSMSCGAARLTRTRLPESLTNLETVVMTVIPSLEWSSKQHTFVFIASACSRFTFTGMKCASSIVYTL